MPWFVYMILATDSQLYSGITTNMARRWHEHRSGKTGAKYFRGRAPMALCLLEAAADRSSASKREAQLKQLTRRAKVQLLLQQFSRTQQFMADHALEIPFITRIQLEQL
ncbi:GIY-YIG nuclease family protein [Cellvibrio japonicus]|uniref:GIY-YIG catalytic domain protein n=1 Tax=Cellvibrio japonicus (strain Ueda107) TaxID=498211 RepID=B3PES6_CELJU|nr:GIY-YIG nuclease family protein [Cellvibrio japonicus]ACE85985.1 GIY-YIG catalytic domain protein [Cellvibrio japonicus Ueda107]QEI12175.1 GIY-YIG nuclease family protein [Cellvibrio japonicus]QEI15749.1 GIY-YIG nuclease family protein [Cellvibrio japonicus]QEI19327.1 GIY-YIG nuclease family protein [Cellvibrio japonicus]